MEDRRIFPGKPVVASGLGGLSTPWSLVRRRRAPDILLLTIRLPLLVVPVEGAGEREESNHQPKLEYLCAGLGPLWSNSQLPVLPKPSV